MRRELHVRFCEGGGVQFPSATRLGLDGPFGRGPWVVSHVASGLAVGPGWPTRKIASGFSKVLAGLPILWTVKALVLTKTQTVMVQALTRDWRMKATRGKTGGA